jgi:hypothetical protein
VREQLDVVSVGAATDDEIKRHEAFEARLGMCYRENALFVQMHIDTQLVHGSIQGRDYPRISHAWCINPDGTIHDAVMGADWPRDGYERFFSAETDVIFSRDEVYEHIRTEKHWGPWT